MTTPDHKDTQRRALVAEICKAANKENPKLEYQTDYWNFAVKIITAQRVTDDEVREAVEVVRKARFHEWDKNAYQEIMGGLSPISDAVKTLIRAATAPKNCDKCTELEVAYDERFLTSQKQTEWIVRLKEQKDALVKAALAVIDRWDTPAWKDVEPTANFINELRKAVDSHIKQEGK